MTRKLYIISIIVILQTPVYVVSGQGTAQARSFYSNALKENRNYTIYLPQGYHPATSPGCFPVIYFLHGAAVHYTHYSFVHDIADDLISRGTIKPVIIVKPDANTDYTVFRRASWYTNSQLNGQFEDYIVKDLVAHIDKTYNTCASRDKRSIMGHSMGGYGAMKLLLKHPGLFKAVASHSGLLDLEAIPEWFHHIFRENGGSAPYTYDPEAGRFTWLTYSLSGAFAPNPSNFPYPADFILDRQGNMVHSVMDKFRINSPAYIVQGAPPGQDTGIYFDVGQQDDIGLLPFNTSFSKILDEKGIHHTFVVYQGGHDDMLESRIPIALEFLDSVMNYTPSGNQQQLAYTLGNNAILFQNYPNPFTHSTHLQFRILKPSFISLKIYDVTGKEVAVLASSNFSPNDYSFVWNAGTLPGGIYYFQMQINELVKTIKLVLVK